MLELDKGLYDEMVEHGLREFPNEACGLLAGKEGRAVRYFSLTNADASPATFRLDPVEHHRVHTELDQQGWDLLGIFHTHTHSGPYPSATDRRRAMWQDTEEPSYPDAYYLIMSLADRASPELRAFRIGAEQAVIEEELTIA
ncbi:MAG TPA: M67 family metallopeptidase [Actinomycetota bacterium]|jgi:proteasome lid subunit RPN8/RPN11|nr:M67 family metallopeptidase [Actinomycetota bacterium]